MCKVLQIETASDICSVSMADCGKIIGIKENDAGRSHASVLSVFIQELLNETEITSDSLDAVAVSIGPGSYTGLRIGVSTAKGMCYGSNIPLIAVPTLQSMYEGFRQQFGIKGIGNCLFAPMLDARRMEVYTAIFNEDGSMVSDTHAHIIENDSFVELLNKNKIYFFGNGAEKLHGVISHPNAIINKEFRLLSVFMTGIALNCCKKKDFANTAYIEPYYLKDFMAILPRKKVLP